MTVTIFVWGLAGFAGLTFAAVFWWLAMGKHSLPDRDGLIREVGQRPRRFDSAVPLPIILEQAITRNDVLRLAWPEDALEPATGMVRWYVQDEFPTGVMPAIRMGGVENERAQGGET